MKAADFRVPKVILQNEVPAATVTKGLAIKGSLADEATDSVERWCDRYEL